MKTTDTVSQQRIRQKHRERNVVQRWPEAKAEQVRTILIVFILSALFMSASLGMGIPVFAHLLKESTSGVRTLSLMMMVPQIALLVLSPFIGYLEDRYGRYPFLLLGFTGLILTNIGFLFAHSMLAYTGIRLLQAIVCVGVIPAQMGMLADVVSEQQRTRRISLILAGHAGGFTLGPLMGGFLLQHWGTTAPFGVSALFNLVVLYLVCTMLPRIPAVWTRHQKAPTRKILTRKRVELLTLSLMLPISFLVGLLVLDFLSAFGRTFVEPQQVLYLYKVLKFTPIQFGLLVSSQGLTMLLGQLLLSRWGDRVGKRMTITAGMASHAFFLFSLLFTHQFPALFLIALLTGIGGGMVRPLLSVCYLNNTMPQHHSSVIGIKEAVSALGEIAGSLTIVLASPWLMPQQTFLIGGCLIVGASLLALFHFQSSRASLTSPVRFTSSLRLDEQPVLPTSGIYPTELPEISLTGDMGSR